MTCACDGQVERARQPDAHGPPRFPRAERGDGRVRIGLDLFTAERAPHTETLDGYLIATQAEHTRDDLLRLRRMLRRGMNRDESRLIYPRDGSLRFKIEMFLAANPNFSMDTNEARINRGHVAVNNPKLFGQETVRVDRFLDCENGRQRLEFCCHAGCAALRSVERFSKNPRDGLVIEQHFCRKQRLVVSIGTAVSLTRDICLGEHRHHARLFERARRVELADNRVRMRRAYRPRVKKMWVSPTQIVDV